MESILGTWNDAVRAMVSALFAYAALIVLLRISGKRTVAKWNAFDLIVTVALGSALASTIVSGTVPVMKGVGAFIMLVALQFVITWSSIRIGAVRRAIKSTPALLVHRGELREEIMRSERVSQQEVLQAVRRRGFGDLRTIEAVVLETDGSFSVIGNSEDEVEFSTLQGVRGLPQGSAVAGRSGS